jgi:hypothetical protein
MRNILFVAISIGVLLLLTACNAIPQGGETNMSQDTIIKKIMKKMDDSKVTGVHVTGEIIEGKDPLYTKYLPGYKVYWFELYNPKSMLAGRPTLPYSAVVDKKNTIEYINSEPEVARDFLLKNIKSIQSEQNATELALVAISLCRMSVISADELNDLITTGKTTILLKKGVKPLNATKGKKESEYTVVAYVLADPNINHILQLTFTFSNNSFDVSSESVYFSGGYD